MRLIFIRADSPVVKTAFLSVGINELVLLDVNLLDVLLHKVQ